MDISFTACVFFVCLFVRLRISPPRIKLAASNFARKSSASWAGNLPFWGTLLPRSPKSDESARGEWTLDQHVLITASSLN